MHAYNQNAPCNPNSSYSVKRDEKDIEIFELKQAKKKTRNLVIVMSSSACVFVRVFFSL